MAAAAIHKHPRPESLHHDEGGLRWDERGRRDGPPATCGHPFAAAAPEKGSRNGTPLGRVDRLMFRNRALHLAAVVQARPHKPQKVGSREVRSGVGDRPPRRRELREARRRQSLSDDVAERPLLRLVSPRGSRRDVRQIDDRHVRDAKADRRS